MNRAPMPEVSGDGPDMSQLMNIFASKTPHDNTIKRIEELENQIKNLGNPGPAGLDGDSMSKLNDLLRRVQSLETRADKSDRRMDLADDMLADHERRIKALESKDVPMPEITSSSGEVDMTALKNFIALEVSKVRNEVNTLESKVKVDLDQLRIELRGYTDQQTDTVSQKLTLKMNEAFEKLSYEQDRLRAEFETFKSKDFRDLEARVTALEKKFLRLQEAFNNLKIPESAGGGVSQEAFDALVQRVNDLEMMLANLRDEFAKWIKEFQDNLNQKADFAQMDKALQDRLSDIVKALTKQFADKGDTRKAFKLHQKQIENLFFLMQKLNGKGENEEDAMFSKKPLGGLSCASCEKGLVDMYGKKVEFMPWNKLPFRDPAERIARVGQGFSKMLSMINPDQLSRYEQQNSKMNSGWGQPMQMSQNEPLAH